MNFPNLQAKGVWLTQLRSDISQSFSKFLRNNRGGVMAHYDDFSLADNEYTRQLSAFEYNIWMYYRVVSQSDPLSLGELADKSKIAQFGVIDSFLSLDVLQRKSYIQQSLGRRVEIRNCLSAIGDETKQEFIRNGELLLDEYEGISDDASREKYLLQLAQDARQKLQLQYAITGTWYSFGEQQQQGGMSNLAIRDIPSVIVTVPFLQKDRPCSICQDVFVLNRMAKSLPGCSHTFHAGCIRLWLKSKGSCPECRNELI